MPLLEIATSQPSCGYQICKLRAQVLVHAHTLGETAFRKDNKSSSTWKLSVQTKVNFNVGHHNTQDAFLIRAVSTLEQTHFTQNENEEDVDHRVLLHLDSNPNIFQPSSETSEVNAREKLRRKRISKANKGNVPWNKGRKHSAETLQRIRERTRLAMQDPKVKMKLINLGHIQTEETRLKIGVGVRMGWQRRREKLMVQETCCFEWQNLIAEASKKGYCGEEGLQWDSYQILDKQLEQEWLESIEERKVKPSPMGNKRAPKSLEQRRKISQAISAKWNDPGYRDRVCSALGKYHGIPVGSPKRPRRKSSGDSESMDSPVKRKVKEAYNNYVLERKNLARAKPKRRPPKYKDPMADTNLEMIKNIRSQRMTVETKKIEAMGQARLLIAEAEKAAKFLEEVASKSPIARASLIETRKLIAEATRSIESVETGQVTPHNKDSYSSLKLNGHANHFGEETDERNIDQAQSKEVNGTCVPFLGNGGRKDYEFGEISTDNLIRYGQHEETENDSHHSSPFQSEYLIESNGDAGSRKTKLHNGEKTGELQTGKGQTDGQTDSRFKTTKKWVGGRLVEISDSKCKPNNTS